MKSIKLSKKLLSTILFLGISFIPLNAQNKKVATSENNNSIKGKQYNTIKQNLKFKSYQKWNKEYSKDKYQKGVISTH